MANWYSTTFQTTDKDIVDVIKNGRTIDFFYNENNGNGHCSLAWGFWSMDMVKVANIAEDHKSSFYIRTCDYLTGTVQEWKYENGVEVLAESRHEPAKLEDITDNSDDEFSS